MDPRRVARRKSGKTEDSPRDGDDGLLTEILLYWEDDDDANVNLDKTATEQ
jgi:hypothetical protein